MKVIELSETDFQKMIDEIKELKESNKQYKKALDFLNTQIDEYNKEFTGSLKGKTNV